VWQIQDFKFNDFGCVASKGVMSAFFGCVAVIGFSAFPGDLNAQIRFSWWSSQGALRSPKGLLINRQIPEKMEENLEVIEQKRVATKRSAKNGRPGCHTPKVAVLPDS
jgi:hypothetical protein